MTKRGPNRKKRIPKLCFTKVEGRGYYVTYRDPTTGSPRKHRFRIMEKERFAEAQVAYHKWLAAYVESGPPARNTSRHPKQDAAEIIDPQVASTKAVPGCVLEVASAYLNTLENRSRQPDAPRVKGTIDIRVFRDRKKHVRDFLQHLNELRGPGAVARLRVADLTMQDVESFNAWIVERGYSASQVSKRMQAVKWIIDRAGRPEHGGQLLSWNWDSRDTMHGKPTEERTLPTVKHLKNALAASDLRHQTIIWLAIGLGFGQRDISVLRCGQIDAKGYDLRREKTGVERYGQTPPLVWAYVQAYLAEHSRPKNELMFVTRVGMPLVHAKSNAITQWWRKLRLDLGKSAASLTGFYTLRHLGATEFGSRPGCSLSDMRRWLGHGASSQMADVYMRPISPEQREVVTWVHKRLASTKLD
jgi:integrase